MVTTNTYLIYFVKDAKKIFMVLYITNNKKVVELNASC